MLAQHLYESALYGDCDQNRHNRHHVEDDLSFLPRMSAFGNTTTSNDVLVGKLPLLGIRQVIATDRRISARFVVGLSLGLMLALAILLDVAERYVHISNFRRHGMTIPSAALQRRRSEEMKMRNMLRGQRRKNKQRIHV